MNMGEPVLHVVAILILKDDSVLLVQHTNSKHIEGIYGLPGGKVEAGEAPIETARRELEEETGLTARRDDLAPLPTVWEADVTFKNGSVRTCSMRVFLCKSYTGDLCGTGKETPEWIPIPDVKNLMLLPNVQEAIREGVEMRT